MAIDISSPTAFEREATGQGSVSQLLSGIGNLETARQNRNKLNQISKARALNPNAPIERIIAELEETQFDPGIAGIIQRFASGVGGGGTVIPELQAQSAAQALKPKTTASDIITFTDAAGKRQKRRVGRNEQNAFFESVIDQGGSLVTTAGKTPLQELSDLTRIFSNAAGPDFGQTLNFGTDDNPDLRQVPAKFPKLVNFTQDRINEILTQFEDKKKNIPKGISRTLDRIAKQMQGFLDTGEQADQEFSPQPGGNFITGDKLFSFRGGKVVRIGDLKLDRPLDLLDARTMRAIGIDNAQTIIKAAQDGLFTDEEIKSIDDGLEKDPSKVTDILALIERRKSGGQDFGTREDGTRKGSGFLGELDLPDGKVATEFSIGVEIDGKETEIPTLVPTLTKAEIELMTSDIIPNNKEVPKSIIRKAVAHARKRIKAGRSPFK